MDNSNLTSMVPLAVLGVAVLSFLAMLLFVWALSIGRRIRHLAETRYDYKVVDLVVNQDPGNHEKQIQKWADEGWTITGAIPLVGGAVEGAHEVRYIIRRPWEPKRLARTIRSQARQFRRDAAKGKLEAQPEKNAPTG